MSVMIPSRVPPNPRAVRLRKATDLLLQTAFEEGSYKMLVTLAQQRFKATKDEYYKVVELVGKAYSDSVADRASCREVIEALKSNTDTIIDADALDMYEEAAGELGLSYSENIGPLRVRLVKSFTFKSVIEHDVAKQCFFACMWYSDWQHAQQITVTMASRNPKETTYAMNNLLTTYLVSTLKGLPENTHKMFVNLSKAQADRYFYLLPNQAAAFAQNMESIRHYQDDIVMWHYIRQRYSSPEEVMKLYSLSSWGPVVFLEMGCPVAFHFSIDLLEQHQLYDELLQAGHAVLDKVLAVDMDILRAHTDPLSDEPEMATPTAIYQADYFPFVQQPSEWHFLAPLYRAALAQPDSKKAIKKLRDKVDKVMQFLLGHGKFKDACKISQARFQLLCTFGRASLSEGAQDNSHASTRMNHLIRYVVAHLGRQDTKEVVQDFIHPSKLSTAESIAFAQALRAALDKDSPTYAYQRLVADDLVIHMKFAFALCNADRKVCALCNENLYNDITKQNDTICFQCIKRLATEAIKLYIQARNDEDLRKLIVDNGWMDPLPDLLIVAACALLVIAHGGRGNWGHRSRSSLSHMEISLFLQTALLLNYELQRSPDHQHLRVFCVKVYLLIGCVSKALELWKFLGVKNILLESLGLVPVDRLATISPAHFEEQPGRTKHAAQQVQHIMEKAIRYDYPTAMIQSLEHGHHLQSLLVAVKAQETAHSCALVLSLVEKRRAERLKGGKNLLAIRDEPSAASLTPDHVLVDTTDKKVFDYNAFVGNDHLEELISFGPPPSHLRGHLFILAERFIDFVFYVQAKDYKPSKPSQTALGETQAGSSICSDLHAQMEKLIEGPEHEFAQNLTYPEQYYLVLVRNLAKLFSLILGQDGHKGFKEEISTVFRKLHRCLAEQTSYFHDMSEGLPASRIHTLHGVSALHAMGMLRESSLLVKASVQYLSAVFDRTKQTARNTHDAAAWMLPELEKLGAEAAAADAKMKLRLKLLGQSLETTVWTNRICEWIFSETYTTNAANMDFKKGVSALVLEAVPKEYREEWAEEVADSWRHAVRGWNGVKFD